MVLKSQPTTAPTIPNTMSMTAPDPDSFTILLAIKPEISPATANSGSLLFRRLDEERRFGVRAVCYITGANAVWFP